MDRHLDMTYHEDGQFSHFDFKKHRTVGASTLVITGDVSDNVDDLFELLGEASRIYEHVVFTDGNHEHHSTINTYAVDTNMALIHSFANSLPNVHYLNGDKDCRFDIGRTAFIGANAWYDWRCHEPRGITFPMALASWCDYSKDNSLYFGTFNWPNVFGAAQIDQMKTAIEQANQDSFIDSIVVVTHSAPIADCLEWREGDTVWNTGSPSYVNTGLEQLFDLNTGKIKLWAYGHTHTRRTFTHKGVTLVNNCYGYPHENIGAGWSMAHFEV